MKQIQAIIRADKTKYVSEVLKNKVPGFSMFDGKGRGSGERQTVRSGRGTGTFVAEYNDITTFITIVDDSQAESVMNAIADAAYSGNPGDGIVTISTIDTVHNISSKQRGPEAL